MARPLPLNITPVASHQFECEQALIRLRTRLPFLALNPSGYDRKPCPYNLRNPHFRHLLFKAHNGTFPQRIKFWKASCRKVRRWYAREFISQNERTSAFMPSLSIPRNVRIGKMVGCYTLFRMCNTRQHDLCCPV